VTVQSILLSGPIAGLINGPFATIPVTIPPPTFGTPYLIITEPTPIIPGSISPEVKTITIVNGNNSTLTDGALSGLNISSFDIGQSPDITYIPVSLCEGNDSLIEFIPSPFLINVDDYAFAETGLISVDLSDHPIILGVGVFQNNLDLIEFII
jgi:hypothetical protein